MPMHNAGFFHIIICVAHSAWTHVMIPESVFRPNRNARNESESEIRSNRFGRIQPWHIKIIEESREYNFYK